ncbi:MAG: hypothetical protein ACYCY9_15075 [Thiobacillus sp.]
MSAMLDTENTITSAVLRKIAMLGESSDFDEPLPQIDPLLLLELSQRYLPQLATFAPQEQGAQRKVSLKELRRLAGLTQ